MAFGGRMCAARLPLDRLGRWRDSRVAVGARWAGTTHACPRVRRREWRRKPSALSGAGRREPDQAIGNGAGAGRERPARRAPGACPSRRGSQSAVHEQEESAYGSEQTFRVAPARARAIKSKKRDGRPLALASNGDGRTRRESNEL
jgi:hypothetical protein